MAGRASRSGTVAVVIGLLIVLCAISFWLSGVAHSQGAPPTRRCADYKELTEILFKHYGEKPQAAGFTSGNVYVELLMHPEGKTWTILVTRPNHPTCILAAGTDWTLHMPLEKGEPL